MNLDTTEALRRSIHDNIWHADSLHHVYSRHSSLAYSYDDQQLDNKVLAAISKFKKQSLP